MLTKVSVGQDQGHLRQTAGMVFLPEINIFVLPERDSFFLFKSYPSQVLKYANKYTC